MPQLTNLTEQQARELFGTDFTGVHRNPEGTFTADETAVSRLAPTRGTGIAPAAAPNYLEQFLSENRQFQEGLRIQLETSLASIREQGAAARAAQQEAGRRASAQLGTSLIRTGGRYTPQLTTGFLTAQETANQRALAEIDTRINSAIAEAQEAYNKQNYSVMEQRFTLLEKLEEQQRKVLEKQQEETKKQNEEIAEEQAKAKKNDLIFFFVLKTESGELDLDRFDPIKLYKQINYNADETPNENNVSFEEIFSVFKFAKEFEKKAADKISTDYSDFLSFKSRNELPQNILSLPTEAEQFFEFRKQFKAAEREPDKPEDSLARIQKLLQIEKLNRELKTLDPSTFIDLLPKEQDGMPVQDMGIAITNILSSTKFSDGERQFALNAFNGFLARGEYVAAKEYILKTANESLGVEAQTQALGRFRAMDAIDRIEFLIEKAKQAGAAPGLL